ncbi:MFS transporter [Pseudoalteromonas sp. MMG013]|uniref:MFS transporter n=1 Tax=Pseudoalteromonas sp. MMG013 TaxID=2822687 RepID=UPI001B3875B9|nr:MFS transporter [Pseudoalteromonas sp. MMG013]MBQ4863926.1 MFS transporter [Pseudoalteromonas sp. MMG013]
MLVLAILLLSCSQLASQIFLPALPQIAHSLSLSQSQSQAMITGYFICLGIAQLVVGPLRDRFGDRPVFLIGQGVFVIGTVSCALATTAEIFSLGRVLQGIGAAAPLLISRTLLAATLSGAHLKSAMATLALAASGVSVLAPWLGGTLSTLISWQSLAWILASYFFMVATLGWWILPANKQRVTDRSVHPYKMVRTYWQLLNDAQFIAIAAFKWLPTFIYLTTQLYFPFLLQQHFALTEQQFGTMMMLPMSGLLIGAFISKCLHQYLNEVVLFALFWPLLLLSALCYLLLPFGLLSTLLGYGFAMVVFGGYFAAYMQLIGLHYLAQAGSVNALVGACELLVFTLLAVGCNAYIIRSIHDLAWITLTVASLLVLAWVKLLPRELVLYRRLKDISGRILRSTV